MLLLIAFKIMLKLLRVKVERIKLLTSACSFLQKGESGDFSSFIALLMTLKAIF